VVVEVIDIAADVQIGQVPAVILAVPTYLLDGCVVSLGYPYPEELFARLHESIKQREAR
jgi:hypothetical protein